MAILGKGNNQIKQQEKPVQKRKIRDFFIYSLGT